MKPLLFVVAGALLTGLSSPTMSAQTTSAAATPATLPARAAPAVGRPFGPLVLPTLDGSRVVDLDAFRGRKLLLIEFASW